jgi:hypothetical protein
MATISLPDLQPTDRVRRGILLYLERGDEIEPLGKGRYLVPGCKGGPYTVDVGIFHDEPEAESCDCPDFQHRGETCKHLVAAAIYRAKARIRQRNQRAEANRRRAGGLDDRGREEVLVTSAIAGMSA